MSETTAGARLEHREIRALRVAFYAAFAAVVLALILLVWTSDYVFVVVMFVGAPLLAIAAIAFGWVILQDLRRQKVL